jgi:hypothetical protein
MEGEVNGRRREWKRKENGKREEEGEREREQLNVCRSVNEEKKKKGKKRRKRKKKKYQHTRTHLVLRGGNKERVQEGGQG